MKYFIIILSVLISSAAFSQKKPNFLENYDKAWVENTFNSLSLDQKIGQILMPRGNTSGKPYDEARILTIVKDYQVGGMVFFAGQPTVQARIVNKIQALSKVPMIIGMDMEWGMAMRLDSTVRFPYQMALGAMQGGDDLIFQMGEEVAKQSKRMGIHINYAPVVDINNNPKNPVINFRSFGEDKYEVLNKAYAYMAGMQSQNLLATAKHFPGHGDTGVDSHYDLPVIAHNKNYLLENELFPYKYLINNGLSGIMTAHLSVPEIEKTPNLAATFSSKIVNDLLKKDLQFEGLTFTDAMDMQGAVKYFPNGEALVRAILAGNDVLETFEDVPAAFNAIKKAVVEKRIPMTILDASVLKILKAKSWVGLNNYKPIEIDGLISDLNTRKSDYLNRMMAEKTLVALKNNDLRIPIQDLSKKTVVVSIDAAEVTSFQEMASYYTETINVNFGTDEVDLDSKLKVISEAANVIVGVHLQNIRPTANYGITPQNQKILNQILEVSKPVVVVFGNPYSLDKIENINKAENLILAGQLTKYTEEAAAQAVFGGIRINGKLSVSVNEYFKLNDGLNVQAIGRLSYGVPEMVGLDSDILYNRIDSVINLGLREKAYPGAVMQVARNGKVIYQKAFGFHTFEDAQNATMKESLNSSFETGFKADVMDNGKNAPKGNINSTAKNKNKQKGEVLKTDLYDLASVTKVSTSFLAVMQLMSESKFDLDKTFGDYFPEFKDSNKEKLTFRDMLTHRSGLKAWIPFWMDCIDSTATLQKALKMDPNLESEFEKTYKKQNFLQRLFKFKPKYTIDYQASLLKNKDLWSKAISTKTIVWKPEIFSSKRSEQYNVEVADTLFMNKDHKQFIFNQIKDSPVNVKQGYVYSDLHYYTYPFFVPLITKKPWENYLKETYKSLGASTLTYNPRRFYELSKIVPTEKDTLFRKTVIHGRVHDEGAGMLDGVSGHAGLFGNANDLMKLMQMYLQKGFYGNKQYIKPEIIQNATDYQFPYEGNRRAIAFDKLDFDKKIANGPQLASPRSYGHSGYTGTFTWIDPDYELVYVFLSNRVYPTRDNNKISSLNIRTEVGNQIIKTILKK